MNWEKVKELVAIGCRRMGDAAELVNQDNADAEGPVADAIQALQGALDELRGRRPPSIEAEVDTLRDVAADIRPILDLTGEEMSMSPFYVHGRVNKAVDSIERMLSEGRRA